jgi:hypothetical protein
MLPRPSLSPYLLNRRHRPISLEPGDNAAGTVSDPTAVSRAIGTALIATAIGIATALLVLASTAATGTRAHCRGVAPKTITSFARIAS